MAKVPFTKLGLKKVEDTKNITVCGQMVEVKQYLPIRDKIDIITNVIENSADDNNFANPVKVEVFANLEIMYAYTNISFTDKQKEDPTKLYDLLEENGIIAEVIAAIPENEYALLLGWIDETIEAFVEFAKFCFEEYKDEVTYWLTFNEINCGTRPNGNLVALRGEALGEIAVAVEQAHGHEVDVHIAGLLEVVAGKDTETSGIYLEGGIETVFHTEIAYGRFLAVLLEGHIAVELRHYPREAAEEFLVVRQFLVSLEAHLVEYLHRVVARSVPQVRVNAFEERLRTVIPAPPEVFAQSLHPRKFFRQVAGHHYTFPIIHNTLLLFCQRIVDSYYKIAQYVHIVDERFIRGIVRIESLVHISVREEFRAHIIEMVTFLQMSVIGPEGGVIQYGKFLFKSIELAEGLSLQLVSEPG